MNHIKPMPTFLIDRYNDWKSNTLAENSGLFSKLAIEGQAPAAMIIGCCDSRVDVNAIFAPQIGEAFVHRNIANLVPPHDPGGPESATAAAVEYAVTALKVAHIVVVGHTRCGGVKGCYDMCSGNAPALKDPSSYVGRWIETLAPAFETLPAGHDDDRVSAFEQAGVLLSLENLTTYPFVDAAMADGKLTLHGAVTNIETGTLAVFDPENGEFNDL